MGKKLRLYIWPNFAPDYTGGLAFAIAESEEEAKEMIEKKSGYHYKPTAWGKVEVKTMTIKLARYVDGGS